jgi:hypothetical protein
MLEHPVPIDPHVILIIAGRSPYCAVAIGPSAGLKQVPGALGSVAVYLDNGIQDHMDSEGHPMRRILEEAANFFTSFAFSSY